MLGLVLLLTKETKERGRVDIFYDIEESYLVFTPSLVLEQVRLFTVVERCLWVQGVVENIFFLGAVLTI